MFSFIVSPLVFFARKGQAVLTLLAINTVLVNPAFSAGFALMEQSGTGLGNAFAGMTATSEDASNQSYNPASLSFLSPQAQLSGGGTLILLNAELRNGSAHNDFLNTPISGGDGGNAGGLSLAPNLYLASEKSGKFRYGLSVTAPYGVGLTYDKDWMGRYSGVESNFMALDFNPAIAYQLSDRFSIGLGVSIQYAQLKASNAIDSSAICLYSPAAAACPSLGLGEAGNSSVDSYASLKGHDVSAGFNVGVIYKPDSAWTLGLAYRSGIEHKIKGDANFSLSAPMSKFLTSGGSSTLQDTGFHSHIKLPQLVTFGAHFKPNHRWDFLLDLAWTGWSSFDQLQVEFDNPSQPSTEVIHDWRDSWRLSVGANRRLNDKWKLRTGVSYDQTPVAKTSLRTVGVPDADRITLAAGLSHEVNMETTVEFAYAYLVGLNAPLRIQDGGGHTLQGHMDLSAHVVGFQVIRKF